MPSQHQHFVHPAHWKHISSYVASYSYFTFGQDNQGFTKWESRDFSMEISDSVPRKLIRCLGALDQMFISVNEPWKQKCAQLCQQCKIKQLYCDIVLKTKFGTKISFSSHFFSPARSGWGTRLLCEVAEPEQTYSAATRSVNLTTPLWFLRITMGGFNSREHMHNSNAIVIQDLQMCYFITVIQYYSRINLDTENLLWGQHFSELISHHICHSSIGGWGLSEKTLTYDDLLLQHTQGCLHCSH